jgi:hypothetical protein
MQLLLLHVHDNKKPTFAVLQDNGFTARVARWFVFKPKIPIWVNFGSPWRGNFWYILWSFVLFYIHILCPFGMFRNHLEYFSPGLECGTEKNLATLFTANRCTKNAQM